MRHHDFDDKILPVGASSVSEESMKMSNQIADLMRDRCVSNSSINVIALGFPKDELLSYDAAAKAKLLAGKPPEEDVTFKKDKDGNLIKVLDEGAQSKKGKFSKDDFGASFSGTASGDTVIFKKDEYGNLIKVPADGGLKTPTYSSRFQTGSY